MDNTLPGVNNLSTVGAYGNGNYYNYVHYISNSPHVPFYPAIGYQSSHLFSSTYCTEQD